jgi:hypothetical protein
VQLVSELKEAQAQLALLAQMVRQDLADLLVLREQVRRVPRDQQALLGLKEAQAQLA